MKLNKKLMNILINEQLSQVNATLTDPDKGVSLWMLGQEKQPSVGEEFDVDFVNNWIKENC